MPDFGERALSYPVGTLAPARWRLGAWSDGVDYPDGQASMSVFGDDGPPTYAALLTGALGRSVTWRLNQRTHDGLYVAALLATATRPPGAWRFTLGARSIDWTVSGALTVEGPRPTVHPVLGHTDYLWSFPAAAVSARTAAGPAGPPSDWTGAFLSFPSDETPAAHWVRVVEEGGVIDDDDDDEAAASGALASDTATLETRWTDVLQANGTVLWRGKRWRIAGLRSEDRKRTLEIELITTRRID